MTIEGTKKNNRTAAKTVVSIIGNACVLVQVVPV